MFDFDIEDDLYYMVMEYIQGGTLHQRIQQQGALPVQDVLRIGVSLADALGYAHQRGMIHRDIKPANVMFADDRSAHPVLTDFGIARILGETALTTSGIVGTPGYVSPEVGRGEPVDERTDIYSMGVMLYEMVTGRLPYYGDTPYAVIMKHIHDPLPSLHQYNADLPEAVEEVIYKALAKRCDLRHQTADDLREALQEALVATPRPLSARAEAIKRGAAAMYAAANLTPIFEVETRVLPPETAEVVEPPITEAAIAVTEETEESPRRRKLILFVLGLLGVLLAAGFIILRGDGAPSTLVETATDTLPALVATEASPTPTDTATNEPTASPTDTATRRPTRVWPTITAEPTDIPPTRTPAWTPLPPTATNTAVPPPPAPPPTNPPATNPPQDGGGQPPPEQGGGGGGDQPPPDDGQSNVVSDTVDEVGDTVEDVVDGLLGR